MRCRRVAVLLGTVLALAGVAPVDAQEPEPVAPAAAPDAATLTAEGDGLRAVRFALLTRIATLTDQAEVAHARLVTAQQRTATAEAAVAEAERALVEHAVQAFVHNGSLIAATRVRGGIFAEVVVDADRAVVDAVDIAATSAVAEHAAAQAALAEARRVEVEVAAAREALEATIAENEVRTAEARAEEARNALARRLAEEERARRGAAEEAAEEARKRLRGAPTGTFATLPGTPTGESGGLAPLGGYSARHLDRIARATAGQAALMAARPFGPIGGLPPGATLTGQVVEGMASWYGPGFDGRPTASGAIYDQQGWTVASKELPLGTVLLITRGDRSVLALVNDRGPYVSGRVLDLSHAVATELGTVGPGVAHVRAQVVLLP